MSPLWWVVENIFQPTTFILIKFGEWQLASSSLPTDSGVSGSRPIVVKTHVASKVGCLRGKCEAAAGLR